MGQKKENNYAFIDTENIVRGAEFLGWSVDWQRFRLYLQDKYHVTKAFLFLGYIRSNEKVYQELRGFGFELIFKEVYVFNGKIKANVDVELTMQVFIDFQNFDKAILVSGDGDFHSLIKLLREREKFKISIAVLPEKTSVLIKKITTGDIVFIKELKKKISFQ